MEKKNGRKEIFNICWLVIAAILHAIGLWIFVYPADFSPMGIDGIATMLYKITGLNAGYFTIGINAILLIAAWFILKKRYVIYTVIFILISSVTVILCEELEMYQYVNNEGTDRLLASAVSGIILGLRTGLMLMIGGCAGGADIIAGMVQVKKPYLKIERIISVICYAIIALSYFVYRDLNSILFAIVHAFVFERAVAWVLQDQRNAVKFEIITQDAEGLKEDILRTLKHGATVLECRGMFTDEKSQMVVTVVNQRQIPEFLSIMKKHPHTFVYYTDVSGVNGNFRWRKEDEAK